MMTGPVSSSSELPTILSFTRIELYCVQILRSEAVIGTANKIPIPPHKNPQYIIAINDINGVNWVRGPVVLGINQFAYIRCNVMQIPIRMIPFWKVPN